MRTTSGNNLRVASQITREINLLLSILHQLLTVAGSKLITVSTAVVSGIALGGLGPLQLQDQVIIAVALQLVQRLLGVLVPGKGDISKASGLLDSVLLHSGQGNSVNAAVSLEQLAQIVLRDGLGEVGHAESVLGSVGLLLSEAEVAAAAGHSSASSTRSNVTVALGGAVGVGSRLGIIKESINIMISGHATLLLLGDEVGEGLGKSGIISILVDRIVGVLNGNEVSGRKCHVLLANLGVSKAGKVLSLTHPQRYAGLELFDSDLRGGLDLRSIVTYERSKSIKTITRLTRRFDTYSLSLAVGGKLHSLLNAIVGRLHLLRNRFRCVKVTCTA